jgi:uncharacterized short protein YbdD (DUF466 family)
VTARRAPAGPTLRARVRGWLGVVRQIVGAPDYERYTEHMRARHPQAPVLTREEFARDRLQQRYDRPGSRCC